MENFIDIGESEIARCLFQKYKNCDVNLNGLKILARRALTRGYSKEIVTYCLEVVIKKNFMRNQYQGNDALDEKRFISDAEFRAIMRYGNADDVLWS